MSVWETLSTIDVSEHTEKKGKFTYLSWAWAWGVLKKNYPEATFIKHEYNSLPFMEDSQGFAYVKVTVTVNDHSLSETMPVLNHQNKAVQNPDSFAVNTSLQRCLAKAIAMHGLGHYIYAGEDLPPSETIEDVYDAETVRLFAKTIQDSMIKDDFWTIGRAAIDNQELFQLANNGTRGKKDGYFSSAEKSKFSDYNKRYMNEIENYAIGLSEAQAREDTDGIQELVAELTDPTDKRLVWNKLENQTKAFIRAI